MADLTETMASPYRIDHHELYFSLYVQTRTTHTEVERRAKDFCRTYFGNSAFSLRIEVVDGEMDESGRFQNRLAHITAEKLPG